MFEKCDSCAHPSKYCIPMVTSLPAREQREWCRMWQKKLGWSKRVMAEKSGVPEGTLAGVLGTSETREARTCTIHAIIGALTDCPPEEIFSCVSESEREIENIREMERERLSSECSHHEEELRRLEQCCTEQAEKIREQEELIKQLEMKKQILEAKAESVEKLDKTYNDSLARMMKIVKSRGRAVTVLVVTEFLLLGVGLSYFLKDIAQPEFGLIRDSYFTPISIVMGIALLAAMAVAFGFLAQIVRERKEKTAANYSADIVDGGSEVSTIISARI